MRLQEIFEKLQKNEVWKARPIGFWRYGAKAYLAVVGMSDRPTLFCDPYEILIEGSLVERWHTQDFVPTFEDMNRNDWEELQNSA